MTINFQPSRDLDLATIVIVFDPKGVDPSSRLVSAEMVEGIEDFIGESIMTARTVGDRGEGIGLVIRRRNIDVLLSGDRIEVRYMAPELTPDAINLMSRYLMAVVDALGELSWIRIGYNFVLSIQTGEVVVGKIKRSLIADNAEEVLGYPLIGASAWLWLEIEGGYFRLRLEPLRESPSTHRLVVNANFTIELGVNGELPSSEQFAARLVEYYGRVDSVLTNLSL